METSQLTKHEMNELMEEYYGSYRDEFELEEVPLAPTVEVKLGELMGEDYNVWIKKDSEFGFNLTLIDESGTEMQDNGIHPCAMDGFAAFCRNYLKAYEDACNRERV